MPLPDQNQLYAYYLARCGHHGVRKPHHAVVALLAEDDPSRALRLATEAAERGVEAADLGSTEDGGKGAAHAESRAAVVALARQRVVRLRDDSSAAGHPIYIGARGMLPLLDVVAELPLVEELDLSNIASWFDNDGVGSAEGRGVAGNDVVRRLCEVLPRLTVLRALDLRGQPIGCVGADRLLQALRLCPNLTELRVETFALDSNLVLALQQVVDEHRAASAQRPPRQPFSVRAYVIPPYVAGLPRLDRKTLREQQVLRALLEDDVNFSSVLSEAELGEMVLAARVMSTTEAIFRCGKAGIRGDGVHLFVLKSGCLRVFDDLQGFTLTRGDCFGDAYDVTLIPGSQLAEEVRGTVYAIPLASSQRLLSCWTKRVAEAWPWLHRTPPLQSVGAWVRLRACTCAVAVAHEAAETVVEVGEADGAVFVVCDGTYAALATHGDAAGYSEREVRAVFSRFDVFGVEALVARRRVSSVCVRAGRSKDEAHRVLAVRGSAVGLLQRQLRHVFVSLAHGYSLHDDLSGHGATPLAE